MLAVGIVVLAMAYRRWRSNRAEAVRLIKIAAGIALAFVVVFKGWTTFQALRGEDHWAKFNSPDRLIHGSPIDELLSTSFDGFGLITSYYLPSQVDGNSVQIWARLLGMLVVAAPLLAMVAFRPRSPRWIVGAVALGGLIAFPAVVEAEIYVQYHQHLQNVPGRYGLSFVPWTLAALALVASDRRLVRTTVAVVSAGALTMALAVYGVFTL
jgi:hypothetical protein